MPDLSCSAAIGVAIVDAIDEARGIGILRSAVADEALVWEKVFHGTPSGIDNAMSASGGVGWFRKASRSFRFAFETMHLVVAHSGESVARCKPSRRCAVNSDATKRASQRLLEAIDSIVHYAKTCLESGDWRSLGRLMDLNQAMPGLVARFDRKT
ncbi:MAG: hypothetical protein R3A47_07740 [Polyangiales bacterium]